MSLVRVMEFVISTVQNERKHLYLNAFAFSHISFAFPQETQITQLLKVNAKFLGERRTFKHLKLNVLFLFDKN